MVPFALVTEMKSTAPPQSRLTHLIILIVALGFVAHGFGYVIQMQNERDARDWVKCGKPWGHPCNCPEGKCKCGLLPGYSCLNCRPMDGGQ